MELILIIAGLAIVLSITATCLLFMCCRCQPKNESIPLMSRVNA